MEESRAIQKYTEWINAKGIDAISRRELLGIISSPEEIFARFETDLSFGTAGLRAKMKTGSACINIYTIAQAALGVARMSLEHGEADRGIVISYDSRKNSREYAEISARIIADAGVQVLLSDRLRPVPMLSFAVRYYQASGGIMITASHNPKEYNGFKVYGDDGGQISPQKAARVKAHIEAETNIFGVVSQTAPLDELVRSGRIRYIGEGWDNAYHAMLRDLSDADSIDAKHKENVRIVYTPLNGSGREPVLRALREAGFTRIFLVDEQAEPDGDFPTLRVPNPEREDTFTIAKSWASALMADVILATDPDSDRLGVAIPDENGTYRMLTGNQIGILLMEYILSGRERAGRIPEKGFCVASIVSSRLARSICGRYGVRLYETLTGSKYIAELIHDKDENGDESFLFGFEEGNGYMTGTAVRDKDAVAACVAMAEMAAVSKSYGIRLADQLNALYRLYGYAAEKSFQIKLEGPEGKEAIRRCMEHYRALGGRLRAPGQDQYYDEVKKFTDFLPKSNVLLYELGEHDWIAMRPSGTEPKLKIYFGFYGEQAAATRRLDRISKILMEDIGQILQS
ncbi:MAG: phospho-sugar mutase [Mogibacterium sp.]|nr:phospho-sugar mutase [Mogibacterium sp.]